MIARLRPIVRSAISALPLPAPTRFVVITGGRTGSNLLLSLLDSHPRVRTGGEVLGEYMIQQPGRKEAILSLGPRLYVERSFKRTRFERVVGLKLLYYQVEEEYGEKWGIDGLRDAMDFLKSQRDIRIIHLKRRNRLETLTSLRVAGLTHQYQRREDQAEQGDHLKIALTPDECEQAFGQMAEWEKLCDGAFVDHDMLEVYYENLVAEQRVECHRLLDFLSLTRRTLTSPLRKQRSRPLSDVIENYVELKQHFAETGWGRFFEP